MSTLEYQLYFRRHLPHYQPEGATVFITFRLAGSMPQDVIARLGDEARQMDYELEKVEDPCERVRQADVARRRAFGRWDEALHAAYSGPQWLNNRQVAGLVASSLCYRDQREYELHAYCIMPNHVHLVITPLSKPDGGDQSLSSIMHSLKGYTAHQANRYLGRSGDFWQHESYDHVVRDPGELQRIIAYVVNNPVKAGLVKNWEEWEWTYCRASC